ncbi:MAG TPA: Asp23/Gls24 family envelope stress response protein [Clostridia bacterium]|nr:Asp23/Gls24 family envelope stress response protein [Clostridia bacterium]
MNELAKEQTREDKIRISEEVIATIAGIAATEVTDVASLSSGFVDGIAGMLGKKSPGRGIKVELKENQVNIDISVVMQYGCKIHEVAREMQTRVRTAVEDMTGLEVLNVNINILGVSMGKDTGKLQVVEEVPPQA